jgi:hypothetical protein
MAGLRSRAHLAAGSHPVGSNYEANIVLSPLLLTDRTSNRTGFFQIAILFASSIASLSLRALIGKESHASPPGFVTSGK